MKVSRLLLKFVLFALNLSIPAWAQQVGTDPQLNFSTWRLDRSWLDESEKLEKYWTVKFSVGRLEYHHVYKETDRKSGRILHDETVSERNLTPLFEKNIETGLVRISALNSSGQEVFSLFVVNDKCLMFKNDIGLDSDACFRREDLLNPCFLEQSFHRTYLGNYETEFATFIRNGGNEAQGLVNFGNPNNSFYNPLSIKDTILSRFPARAFKDFANDRAHRLEMGYKFALSASEFPLNSCQLKVSQYEYKFDSDPAKNVHHHLLAGGEDVHSAGAMFFFHDGQSLEKISITNRSSRFCPSFQSLQVVKKIFLNAGIDESLIELDDGSRNGCVGN